MNKSVDIEIVSEENIRRDLELTICELSNAYEELSLLYKLTEVLSGISVDEITEHVVEEAMKTMGVKTAALLFLDENNEHLCTKSCRGKWDKDTVVLKDDKIIWSAVSDRKAVAFCRLSDAGYKDYIHAEKSILVCPLVGKTRVIGTIVLADRRSNGEFYSNDIKLMTAIASHAALQIENALLNRELEDFLISAIKSLVKALEASTPWTAGHTERVTTYAIGIGENMGLNGRQLERLMICSLLHDIGKIAVRKDILDKPGALTKEELIEVKKHALIGSEILGGFKQLQDVILGIKYHHEYWDGVESIFGLKGEDIPLMARILAVADSFDAMTSDRPYRGKLTMEETLTEITRQSGKQYDPKVVEALKLWISQQHSSFLP